METGGRTGKGGRGTGKGHAVLLWEEERRKCCEKEKQGGHATLPCAAGLQHARHKAVSSGQAGWDGSGGTFSLCLQKQQDRWHEMDGMGRHWRTLMVGRGDMNISSMFSMYSFYWAARWAWRQAGLYHSSPHFLHSCCWRLHAPFLCCRRRGHAHNLPTSPASSFLLVDFTGLQLLSPFFSLPRLTSLFCPPCCHYSLLTSCSPSMAGAPPPFSWRGGLPVARLLLRWL